MRRGPEAVLAVTLLLASEARADPASPKARVSVRYQAPDECPASTDFSVAVTGRTELVELSDEGSATTRVQVKVRATPAGYSGQLVLASRGREPTTRTVEDPLCEHVIDALALVTALALDPNAALAHPQATAPTPAPSPPPAPLFPEPPNPHPVPSPSPSPNPSPSPSPNPSPNPPPSPSPSPGPPLHWHLNAGATADILGGPAPDPLFGGGAYAELETSAPRLFIPTVRLTLFAAANGVIESPGESFTLLAARIDACPIRVGTDLLWLRPCLALEVGDLLARGAAVPHPQSHGAAWVAPALLVRVGLSPWGDQPLRPFFGVHGGVLFPLARPSFEYLEPTVQIYQAPRAAPTASFTAGVRFW